MAHPSHMRAIAERSATQLGLVTTDQLTEVGVSEQARRTLEAHGCLDRLGTRVWRVAGSQSTWSQRLLAAVFEAGPDAVGSHLAACAWWRFPGIEAQTPEVTVPRGQRPRCVSGIVHSSRDVLAVDVDRRGVVPVTTPTRSIIDAAPRLPPPLLESTVDAALRSGLLRAPYLRWRIHQLGQRGRSGVAAVREILPSTTRREREESWLERRLTAALRDAGLPPPRLQATIRHSGGRARVDMAYDEARLALEADGHATHATRRERQADAERAARLVAAGWRVARFTYEDVVERPDYVIDTVRALLGLQLTELVT